LPVHLDDVEGCRLLSPRVDRGFPTELKALPPYQTVAEARLARVQRSSGAHLQTVAVEFVVYVVVVVTPPCTRTRDSRMPFVSNVDVLTALPWVCVKVRAASL
jgi:hypothetical protein